MGYGNDTTQGPGTVLEAFLKTVPIFLSYPDLESKGQNLSTNFNNSNKNVKMNQN